MPPRGCQRRGDSGDRGAGLEGEEGAEGSSPEIARPDFFGAIFTENSQNSQKIHNYFL